MSLRSFHALFIAVSVLMSVGVGVWAVGSWQPAAVAARISLALLSFASAIGLTVYGTRFLRKTRKMGLAAIGAATVIGSPSEVLACAVCIGNTDSILASGMNNGIMVLLGVIGTVLACCAWFMLSLARRAWAAEAQSSATRRPEASRGTQFDERVLAQEGV